MEPDAAAAEGGAAPDPPHERDHVLVKLEPGVAAKSVLPREASPVFDRWQEVPVPPGKEPEQIVEELTGRPGVDVASLDYSIRLDPPRAMRLSTPSASASANDVHYHLQWHFPPVQLEAAWDVSTGSDVVVAVVDTGISREGEDLDCHTFVAEYDAITDTEGAGAADDDNGHGTHVAGTVAQCTNNGVGVAGVAFDASLMPVKVLDASGVGKISDIAAGIDWARRNGADAINLSLGADCGSATWPDCSFPIINDAIEAAAAADVVIVAAAGNKAQSVVAHPANHPDVVAVGAVDYRNALAPYSSRGAHLDVVAPGGDTSRNDNGDDYVDGVLQETFGSEGWGYYFFQGTSMATPHVAGAAALLRSHDSSADRTEIVAALQATARDLGTAGCDSSYGRGIIQIADALNQVGESDRMAPVWPAGASLTASDIEGTEVTLTWPEPCADATHSGYRVFRDGARIGTVDANTTTVRGLVPATSYQLAVRPVDSAGNMGAALSVTVETPDTLPPGWPSGAALEVTQYGETSLELSWSPATDNVGVTGYRLRQAGSTGFATGDRSAAVTGLEPGTQHTFEVLARDEAGNWSEPMRATVRTARAFIDTADSVFYDDILWLSGEDITRGCNPPTNDLFCPDDPVTRGQMAAFLARALGLNAPNTDTFEDDNTSVFEADIEALAASGITRGCNPPANTLYCPDDPVTRGQMAAFLNRALSG